MKKQNLLVGLGAFSIGIVPVLSVVSCNNEHIFSNEQLESIKNLKILLNDQGKNKTADEFYEEGSKSGNWINVLNKYTNWNTIVSQASEKGMQIGFDSVKKVSGGVEINITINGKADKLPLYGFRSTNTILAEVIKNFKLTVKSSNQNKTAEEVADEYAKSTASTIDKDKALLNNFDIPNTNITVKNGKLVINNAVHQEEINLAIQSVSWNSFETDLNKKGTEIIINFQFSYFDDEKNQTYSAFHQTEISGFASYNQKFNSLVTEFKNSHISAKVNTNLGIKISADVLVNEFNKATTDEARFNVLKDNTNIETIPAFDKNANLAYSAKVNQGGLSVDSANDTVVNMLCSFTWKGMTEENITLEITQFGSTENIENILSSIQLKPTHPIGTYYSSHDVYEHFQRDPSSIYLYVDFSPVQKIGVKVSITSVWANTTPTVPMEERGTTLVITGKYSFNGEEGKVKFKPIVGFTPLVEVARDILAEEAAEIELKLNNSNIYPSEVNTSNWKSFFSGIPAHDQTNSTRYIDNVVIEADNSTGTLGVRFDWCCYWGVSVTTRTFKFNVLKDNGDLAKSFESLKQQMQNNNYFDTIIKEGESKSNFFTSYFGNQLSPINALSNLFDLPNISGIEIDLSRPLKYSKTDSTLSNTQLRIPLLIRNKLTSETFEKEFIVDGFMDPFEIGSDYINGRTLASLINQNGQSAIKFNNPDYEKYADVPDLFKHQLPWANNYATWQTTWLTWGVDYPVSYYGVDNNSYLLNSAAKTNTGGTVRYDSIKNFAIKSIRSIINNIPNAHITLHTDSLAVNSGTYGLKRTLNKDQDGVVRTDVTFTLTLYSNLRDKKGNLADYNYVTVDNLYFFIYWRNGWWK